jgi:hypothetical protein
MQGENVPFRLGLRIVFSALLSRLIIGKPSMRDLLDFVAYVNSDNDPVFILA